MIKKYKSIGLVATGEELVNGEILNTNGQYFTKKFIDCSMTPGQQVIVGDDVDEIQTAITYILQAHSAVITIGGLGPTSDDKTRLSLAHALKLELVFYPAAWDAIIDMLTSKGLEIPETNRQQAFLPAGSELILNPNGTAAACYIRQGEQDIFMLPGPPNECLPIFDKVVLPKLMELNYARQSYRKFWLLYGVSEGLIASKLDPIMERYPNCNIGYRVHYPYLEVKLHATLEKDLDDLIHQFIPLFKDKVVSEKHEKASQQLIQRVEKGDFKIEIIDQATGGMLQERLLNPKTFHSIKFCQQASGTADFTLSIAGFDEYWEGLTPNKLCLELTIAHQDDIHTEQHPIPFRFRNSLVYAVELISWRFLQYLNQ